MKQNILILLLLFSFSLSKAQQKEYLQKLNDCINERVNLKIKKMYGIDSFDYYKLINKVEAVVFNNPNKEGYMEYVKKIESGNFSKNKLIEEGLDEMNRTGFFVSTHIVDILNNCPYIALNANQLGETPMSKRQKVIEQSYSNSNAKNTLIDYFNLTSIKDFEHIEFRSPILIMILANYLKLNPR
ncbi:hypothetical protein GWK08_13950 [Leptobacterium flavescens]|uniref:Uncharacterized protein n=1 Tax=Leptobacterium flavescens TaxID=472055 RepID=A0A6P0UUQ8_9FLAO|nr:hypothetical protein [Leptobacterium flavescens]NER14553.1 hypothetical protein [Leptobacterium flavescens]